MNNNFLQNNLDVWETSFDPNFTEICAKSRIPHKWASYQRIAKDPRYDGSVLKPINKYVEALYPPPKLVEVSNSHITLRQFTHADVFILVTEESEKFLDRPWMRQFYNSNFQAEQDPECFDRIFVAYTPWILDCSIEVSFKIPGELTAFKVFETDRTCSPINSSSQFVEPFMIPFRFKKVGPHMIDNEFGKVKKPAPLYDMVFQANDIIVERVKEFYAKN